MHARHNTNAVYTSGARKRVSAARSTAILSAIPRNKADIITGYNNDWKDIESDLVSAVTMVLKANIRVYGNAIITEDFEEILSRPDEFHVSAHNTYIKHAKIEHPKFLSSTLVRQVFDGVEFSNDDMKSILQLAAKRVPRTSDEPPLTVLAEDGELIVTFAH